MVQGSRVIVLARSVQTLKPLDACFPPLVVASVRTNDLVAFSC